MSREVICKECGHVGYPKKPISFRHNFLMSSLLWFLMLPGLLYFAWRLFGGSRKACEGCGSSAVSNTDSGYGKVVMDEMYLKKLNEDIAKNSNKNQ